MKTYKNSNDGIFEFEDDCFDEDGKIINSTVEKIITVNELISITSEEAEVIRNYKTPEQIAEAERIANLPSAEAIEKAKMELIAVNLLTEAGLI